VIIIKISENKANPVQLYFKHNLNFSFLYKIDAMGSTMNGIITNNAYEASVVG